MDRHELRQTLERLDQQLLSAEAATPETHAELTQLRAEVQRALASADHAAEHRPLGEQLRNAIPSFEVSHPTLTRVMAEVVDILNRIGI